MRCGCDGYLKFAAAIAGTALLHCGVLLAVHVSNQEQTNGSFAVEVAIEDSTATPATADAERSAPVEVGPATPVVLPYVLLNAAIERDKPAVAALNGFNDSLEGGTARPDAPIRSGGGGTGDADAPLAAGQLASGGGSTGSGPGLGTGVGGGAEFSAGTGNGSGIGANGSGAGSGLGKAPLLRVTREAEALRVDGGDYPAVAKRAKLQGVVTLKVEILASGRVGEIELEQSSGHQELDAAAVSAAKGWKFKPACSDDTPVTTWRLVPVRYVLK